MAWTDPGCFFQIHRIPTLDLFYICYRLDYYTNNKNLPFPLRVCPIRFTSSAGEPCTTFPGRELKNRVSLLRASKIYRSTMIRQITTSGGYTLP
ncbi:unnamed protein product [Fusarium graminearum]|nr:unnamed protein product [Fusarium graminearum]CAG1983791.1 unnamed protein product [Fusarium graminearum]